MTTRPRVRWAWGFVALLAAAVTLFLLLGVRVGSCTDYATGAGECSSGPLGGTPGAAGTAIVGAGVVALSVRRTLRR